MRLIDAEALENEFAKHVPFFIEDDESKAFTSGLENGYIILQNAPTVRCETCRDYLTVYCPCEVKSKPNWVCGDWAERKEECD